MFFFFNDTATTEIYTLSLHDALPISAGPVLGRGEHGRGGHDGPQVAEQRAHRVLEHQGVPRRTGDRKSTRLNSSHANISYAVFCLTKKNSQSAPPSRSYLCFTLD